MKHYIQAMIAWFSIITLFAQMIPIYHAYANTDEVMYPLQEISKLECRFEDFDTLGSNCKEDLPILHTKDYQKYASKNGGYNDFTRLYTVLWGSSYKYWWDVGSGWHQGTDIATAKGTPVYSIADGKVIAVGNDLSWGIYVSIQHTINGKDIISNYAHLSAKWVTKGERVSIGDKIGEVGSTGNSTGNHLHFQIDFPNAFHPYYYSYKACPYSYYEITEKGLCFTELSNNTVDPLAFLESNGAILEHRQTQIHVTTDTQTPETKKERTTQTDDSKTQSQDVDTPDIFSTTVYLDIGTSSQVKEVQRIYNKLGYYDGRTSGDYEDVIEAVIAYQLDTGVLSSREDDGAWWFWPKTRAQTKKDYDVYVASWGKQVLTVSKPANNVTATPKPNPPKVTTQTVSRKNLMTREERETKEIQDFLNMYDIRLHDTISHVVAGTAQHTTLSIKNSRGKGFRGNTPWSITFEFDTSMIDVFPQSFYNFTDGTRNIKITGKKAGNTPVKIKIGDVIVDTLSITVGEPWKTIESESAKLYIHPSGVIGQENRGIVLMKDPYGNKLLKTPYEGTFSIHADKNVEYCIKKWNIADVKEVYRRNCYDSEYQDTLTYDYTDTVWGLLLFGYRVKETGKTTLNVQAEAKQTSIATHTTHIDLPKWLTQEHVYFNEIMVVLQSWVVADVKKWYFLEDRPLTQYDANLWIANMLRVSGETEKLKNLWDIPKSKTVNIKREDLLTMLAQTLEPTVRTSQSDTYIDYDQDGETLVENVLGDAYQWKDDFWANYFQPGKKITRGEAAYMIVQALEHQNHGSLVRR